MFSQVPRDRWPFEFTVEVHWKISAGLGQQFSNLRSRGRRVFSFSVDIWSFHTSLCGVLAPCCYDSLHITLPVLHSPTSCSPKMYPKPQQIQLWSQFQYSHSPTQIKKKSLIVFLSKGCLSLFTCLVPQVICAADVMNVSPHHLV